MRRSTTKPAAFLLVAALCIWTGWNFQRLPTEAQSKDLLAGYTMIVEIDGITRGPFRGVEGIQAEFDVLIFRDGANPDVIQKRPGNLSLGGIVLKFDPSPVGNALWTWYSGVLAGNLQRKTVTITLLNSNEKPVVLYRFLRAWPSKWEGPRLVTASTAVPIESLTIVYEGMERSLP